MASLLRKPYHQGMKTQSAGLFLAEVVSRPVSLPRTDSLSIVIPVYNGATTVEPLVRRLIEANPGCSLQIVLVNDASVDGSAAACRKVVEEFEEVVTFVDLARNAGEHNSVMAGLKYAVGDYCVVMDDDFQNPPAAAYELYRAAIKDGRDIVFSAYTKKNHHVVRNIGSWVVNRLVGKLMGLPQGLYLSSFKCLSRFAVDRILEYRGPFPYIDGLALRVTRNVGVVTTPHEKSRKGKSGYTVSKLLNLCFSLAVNFSILPLRVSSFLGLLLSLCGLAGAGVVIAEKVADPTVPVGWSSLAVFVLFLSGVQLLMLGVIGEYLGQLVLTVNGTPQYVVRSVMGKQRDTHET